MKNFMNYDFNIEKIVVECFVAAGTGAATHRDRASHGLAMHLEGEKEYVFSDGKRLTVKANDIIYLPKNKLDIIAPAIDYIHKNYTGEIISIEKLSLMCGITSECFRRIFKSFFGTTPIDYINNLKITRAKELLESQLYSVTNVALKSGYTEMSHFSREFKKATGLCPSDYMKKVFDDGCFYDII